MSDESAGTGGAKRGRRGGGGKGAARAGAGPMRAVAKALWKRQLAQTQGKLSPEERKAAKGDAIKIWKEQRKGFLGLARGVIQGLDKEGYEVRKKS